MLHDVTDVFIDHVLAELKQIFVDLKLLPLVLGHAVDFVASDRVLDSTAARIRLKRLWTDNVVVLKRTVFNSQQPHTVFFNQLNHEPKWTAASTQVLARSNARASIFRLPSMRTDVRELVGSPLFRYVRYIPPVLSKQRSTKSLVSKFAVESLLGSNDLVCVFLVRIQVRLPRAPASMYGLRRRNEHGLLCDLDATCSIPGLRLMHAIAAM